MMTMKKAISMAVKGQNLSIDEAREVMEMMLGGTATQAQIASFLTALRMKSETLDEIIGCATVMKEKAMHVTPKRTKDYLDMVGTGGDGTNTFNISTTSAFVAAGAGLSICKHGNRAISSKSGSIDVLEQLGINVMLEGKAVERCLDELGIGFMFAQVFHKSMKNVGQARKEMGIRTIFNILGPLSNPSDAKMQVIGVFSPNLTEPFAQAMRYMGVKRAMVISGEDGMDEITTTGETFVSEIKDDRIINYKINPKRFGISIAMSEELTGGDAVLNAKITRDILSGTVGHRRDIVLLNAGAALYIGGKAGEFEEGIELAAQSIDSGAAYRKLEQAIEFTNSITDEEPAPDKEIKKQAEKRQ